MTNPYATYITKIDKKGTKTKQTVSIKSSQLEIFQKWNDLISIVCENDVIYRPIIVDQYTRMLGELNNDETINLMTFVVAFENQCKYVEYSKHTCSFPRKLVEEYKTTFINVVKSVETQSINIEKAIDYAYTSIRHSKKSSDSELIYINNSVKSAKELFYCNCRKLFDDVVINGIVNNYKQDDIIEKWNKSIRNSALDAMKTIVLKNQNSRIKFKDFVFIIDKCFYGFDNIQKPIKGENRQQMGLNSIIRRLPKSAIYRFKNSLGRTLDEVGELDPRTRLTFERYFSVFPDSEKVFFSVCTHCQNVDTPDGKGLSDGLLKYKILRNTNKTQSENFNTKIESMLETSWNNSKEVLISRIASFIRQLSSSNIYVDADSMYCDLMGWDNPKLNVQLRFVRTIFGSDKNTNT